MLHLKSLVAIQLLALGIGLCVLVSCGSPAPMRTLFPVTTASPRSTEPSRIVNVGRETDFAPGSVTAMELQTTFSDPDPPAIGSATPGVITRLPRADISPVRIFLVRDDGGKFLALYARDPFRGCRIEWLQAAQRFEDPCFGSKYSKAGQWLEGPSQRGLDRFGVSTTGDGKVVVDVTQYEPRQRHQ